MKTILITGATDGIGFETAKLLTADGHHLLLHGRNIDKLEDIKRNLKYINNDAVIETYCADLSRFSELKQMTNALLKEQEKIDVIINNAGVFKIPDPIGEGGLDVRFTVNTVAPFLITKLLTPLVTENGRIINLSSAAQAPINLSALSGLENIADEFSAYAQSKLALTIWSQELAKSLKSNQIMVAVNPGSLLATKMVKEGFGLAGNDLSIGANILYKAALSDEFLNASGKYYDNDAQAFASPHSEAQDKNMCHQLMVVLERIYEKF